MTLERVQLARVLAKWPVASWGPALDLMRLLMLVSGLCVSHTQRERERERERETHARTHARTCTRTRTHTHTQTHPVPWGGGALRRHGQQPLLDHSEAVPGQVGGL